VGIGTAQPPNPQKWIFEAKLMPVKDAIVHFSMWNASHYHNTDIFLGYSLFSSLLFLLLSCPSAIAKPVPWPPQLEGYRSIITSPADAGRVWPLNTILETSKFLQIHQFYFFDPDIICCSVHFAPGMQWTWFPGILLLPLIHSSCCSPVKKPSPTHLHPDVRMITIFLNFYVA